MISFGTFILGLILMQIGILLETVDFAYCEDIPLALAFESLFTHEFAIKDWFNFPESIFMVVLVATYCLLQSLSSENKILRVTAVVFLSLSTLVAVLSLLPSVFVMRQLILGVDGEFFGEMWLTVLGLVFCVVGIYMSVVRKYVVKASFTAEVLK